MTTPKKPKALPHPFAGLMGMGPMRLPKTPNATLVLEGKRVQDLRAVKACVPPTAHPDDVEIERSEERRLASLVERTRNAAKYQRERQNPLAMARRAAWNEAHAEERRAYMAAYRADPANRERILASKLAHQKRAYAADPEKHRERQRKYYEAHRDEILAKSRQRNAAYYAAHRDEINARARARNKAAKAAATGQPTTTEERT